MGVIPDALNGANLTENAARLVIKDRNVLFRDFLARFLTSPLGREQIDQRTNKVGQPKLAIERIATIEISFPAFSYQQRIASQLSSQMASAERLRQALADQLDAINKVPSALLRRAFNGEL